MSRLRPSTPFTPFALVLVASLCCGENAIAQAIEKDGLPPGAVVRIGSRKMLLTGSVGALRFIGGDQRLLAVGSDGTIQSIDPKSGIAIGRFGAPTSGVHQLAVTPDESSFYAVSIEGLVTHFRREALDQPEQLQVNSLFPTVSPTFDHICGSNPDGLNFDLYDMTGKPLRTIEGQGHKTIGSVFSEDGTMLALLSYRIPEGKGKSKREAVVRIVKVGAVVAEEQVKTITLPGGLYFKKVRFLPGNDRLVVADTLGYVRIVDISRGLIEPSVQASKAPINDLAVSKDCSTVAVGSDNGELSVFKVDGLQLLYNVVAHRASISSVALSESGAFVASGATDSSIRVFDVGSGEPISGPDAHDGQITLVASSPDEKYLATATNIGVTYLWNAATYEPIRTVRTNEGMVNSIEFSPTEGIVAIGGGNGDVVILDTASGEPLKRMIGSTSAAFDVAFTPDGAIVYAAFADGVIRGFDAHTGAVTRSLEYKTQSSLFSVAVSHDGKHVAAGASSIKVWNEKDESVLEITECKAPIYSMFYTPDDRFLVVGLADGTIRVYDAASGEKLRQAKAGQGRVKSLRLSADGSEILVCCETDNAAHLFKFDTLEKTRDLVGHDDPVHGVAFLGKDRLVTGSVDFTALVWKR